MRVQGIGGESGGALSSALRVCLEEVNMVINQAGYGLGGSNVELYLVA